MVTTPDSYTHGISLRLSISFSIVVLLTVALTFVGLNHMSSVKSQMKRIVEVNNTKVSLAQVMRNSLYGRAISMHSIAVLQDVFLQDEEYMHFNKLGTQFYMARQQLEELDTTEEEQVILDRIRELTQRTQPGIEAVVDMGRDGDTDHIQDIIRLEAIPQQRLIADQVSELVSVQEKLANQALNDAQMAYTKAKNLMLFLGGSAVLLGIVIAVFVIRKVTGQARQLERQALHDELTGLPNRLLFNDRLKKAILRGQRESAPFSIILMDLNKFKAINDTLGHNVGDLLLREVARRLKNSVRKVDTIARLGGDEFVVILESMTTTQATQFAAKLSDVMSSPFLLMSQEIDMAASMGIASYPDHGHDCMTLLNRADVAMYDAKRRNTPYSHFSENIKSVVNLPVSARS